MFRWFFDLKFGILFYRKQKGTPTLEAFDTQVAYFSELDRLHMDLSLFGARIQGDSKTAAGPKWSSALPQVMIDSTWKLGNWDEMETIVSSSSNNSFIAGYDLESNNSLANSAKSSPVKGDLGLGSNQRNAPSLTVLDATPYFASNIGHVLLSLQRGEGLFQVHQKLDDIRHLALAPLNAALLTNQKTAYQRTYQQSIVPLHLIHDVMLFEKMIFARLVEKQSASQGSGCNANGDGAQQDMKDEEAILKAFSEMKRGWEARNRILPLSAYSDSIMKVSFCWNFGLFTIKLSILDFVRFLMFSERW